MEQSTQEIELEAKGLLIESEYSTLLAFFELERDEAKKQVNYYLDTQDMRLNARSITLRVREKKGIYELTVKEDASEGGRLETNHRPLTSEQLEELRRYGVIPDGNVKDALNRLGVLPPFLYQGDLITYRIEIPWKGCKLALDYNTYLGTSDYEIEVEKDSESADEQQILTDLLKELDIEYRPAISKTKRFFKVKEGK